MRELHIEGVAIHGDPESCVGVREGDGEALTGAVQAGLLSREIKEFGVPTLLTEAEGHTVDGAIREPSADPARSENLCMYGISMRENREIPHSPVRLITGRAAQGRLRPQA